MRMASYMYKRTPISAINTAFIYSPKMQKIKKGEKQNQKGNKTVTYIIFY